MTKLYFHKPWGGTEEAYVNIQVKVWLLSYLQLKYGQLIYIAIVF